MRQSSTGQVALGDLCPIDGCGKSRHQGQRFCASHYMKAYRHGDPLYVHKPKFEDLVGRRFGMLVVLERVPAKPAAKWRCRCDCGVEVIVQRGRLHRGGVDLWTSCGDGRHRRPDVVEYSAAHGRVRKDLGKASTRCCVDCGMQAAHWSYSHADPNEMISQQDDALGLPYSLDQSHYEPRCVPCHKRFDLGHASN